MRVEHIESHFGSDFFIYQFLQASEMTVEGVKQESSERLVGAVDRLSIVHYMFAPKRTQIIRSIPEKFKTMKTGRSSMLRKNEINNQEMNQESLGKGNTRKETLF